MDMLLNTQEERCRMEIYSEYLRKIPQLLTQLEAVEKMYEKALTEENMLTREPDDHSRELYSKRLSATKKQCLERSEDIRQQLRLIFSLKRQLEEESTALVALQK